MYTVAQVNFNFCYWFIHSIQDFTVEDTLPYAVDLCYESSPGGAPDPKYDDESVMKSLQVFKRFNRLPSTKEIVLGIWIHYIYRN